MIDRMPPLTAENFRSFISGNEGLVLIYKNHCPHCGYA
jgi:hypothetical protein